MYIFKEYILPQEVKGTMNYAINGNNSFSNYTQHIAVREITVQNTWKSADKKYWYTELNALNK